VRYSALLTGVFYGILHQRTLQKAKDEQRTHDAVHDREALIKQAKEAWQRRKESSKDTLVTDPDDPKFDLEKLIAKWEKEAA